MKADNPLAEISRKFRDDYVGWILGKTLEPLIDLAFPAIERVLDSRYKPIVALENGWLMQKDSVKTTYRRHLLNNGLPAKLTLNVQKVFFDFVDPMPNAIDLQTLEKSYFKIGGMPAKYGPNHHVDRFEIEDSGLTQRRVIQATVQGIYALKGPAYSRKDMQKMTSLEVESFYQAFCRGLEGAHFDGLDPLRDMGHYIDRLKADQETTLDKALKEEALLAFV